MSEQVGAATYHPWKRPYCWYYEHDWVDDGFMGDSHECARCGAFDGAIRDKELDAFLLGLVTGGILCTLVIVVVAL